MMEKSVYEKHLKDSITATYKKADQANVDSINIQSKKKNLI